MKKTVKILCFLLCIILCAQAFSSCSAKPLIECGDKSISINVYEFLLSRMKGTLAYYGYDVDDERFWRTVVDLNKGTTYNDYFCATILQQTVYYAIADMIFDSEGLELDEEQVDLIDSVIDAHIKRAGSKSKLNAELKEFGVNCDILREIYILEAKIELLKEHLYGKSGELIEPSVKEEYFNESYVAFKQIFIATYDYLTDTDRFGDTVYYTDEKHKAIAYDKVNGKTQKDEFGKEIKDIFGDVEYFDADGRICYDKTGGVIGYVTNDDGDRVIKEKTESEKAELYNTAKDYALKCDGSFELFEQYASMHDESDSDSVIYLYSSSGYYASQNDAVAYFDDIASLLSSLDAGECDVFKSEYGYHVVCRYENEAGAYDEKENKDMFSDFYDSLISRLFDSLCARYEDGVTIDREILNDAPDMIGVGSNTTY